MGDAFRNMRIVYMGTPEFAVAPLQAIINSGGNVVAIITSTDKYGGRGGKTLLQSAIKKYAVEQNIPVLQPKNLKSPKFLAELKSYKADIQVVVAFRMLPTVVWDMPKLGTYNLHGSLLPKYRGAAPINWAIINGDKKTGVTFFKLKHEIDTGDMLLQKEITIHNEETAGELHDRMMLVAAEVVVDSLKLISEGNEKLISQNNNHVTKAPKIFHKDCEIEWAATTIKVFNFIRGLSPYPCAWTRINGKEIKIYKSKFFNLKHNIKPGAFVTDNKSYLSFYTNDGRIDVLELKMEGKRKMTIESFLNGFTIQ